MSISLCQKNSLVTLSEFFHRLGISHTFNYWGMGKTGRGAGVGVGDQWVKPGDGNWEIT